MLVIMVLHFKDHLTDEGTCEILSESNLTWTLIVVNFVLLVAATILESLRRLQHMYVRSQLTI